MRKVSRVICVFLFLVSSAFHSTVKAKVVSTPIHYQYTVEDGLNSNFITDLYNDSRGLLWIGTQNGINYFDGREFHSIDFSLVNESFVAKICEDKYGTIWFATLGGSIFKIRDRKAIPLSINGKIEDFNSFLVIPLDMMIIEDTILLSSNKALYKIHNNSIHRVIRSNGHFTSYLGSLMGALKYKEKRFTTGKVNFNGKRYTLKNTHDTSSQSSYYNNSKNSFAISSGKWLYQLVGDSISNTNFNAHISNSIYYEDDSTLWVGTLKKGAFKLINGRIKEKYFTNKSVHSIIKDFEGGIWIGTEFSGLIYIPSIDVQNSSIQKKNFLFIEKYNNSLVGITTDYLLYSNKSMGIAIINPDTVRNVFLHHSKTTSKNYLGFVMYTNGRHSWAEIDWEKRTLKNQLPVYGALRQLMIKENDTLYASYAGLIRYSDRLNLGIETRGRAIRRVEEIIDLGNNVIQVTHNSGISFIQYTKESAKELRYIPSERGITHYFELKNKKLYASKDDFLYELDTNQNKLIKLDYLPRTDIRCKYSVDDSTVILGTSTGIKVLKAIDILSDNSLHFELLDISHNIGLLKSQIENIEVINDTIYALSNFKITTLPLSIINESNPKKGKILLNSIKVNGIIVDQNRNLTIHNDESVVFDVSIISFRDKNLYQVESRLLPIKPKWTTEYSETVDFYSLPANEYTFQIRDPYGQTIEYQFTVSDYYYQKWWFFLLACIPFIILLSIPFYLRYQFHIARSKLEAEKNNWRLKTLTSQLKPHFIFNALSSIQSFILKNETRTSNEFLSKFSTHIRNALEQTNKDTISLDKALAAASTYLELEQMRLDGAFQFEINTQDINPEDYSIPVMLLQPYVENAVVHGISAIDYPGKITIDVQKKEKEILIQICDNGKGLEHSTHKGHGLGTSINRERINLLNKKSKNKYSVEIKDNPVGEGVCIRIKIAIDNEKN